MRGLKYSPYTSNFMKTIIIIGTLFIFSCASAFNKQTVTYNLKTTQNYTITNCSTMIGDIDPPVYPQPQYPPKL